jgi:hypothetical protein
MRARVQLVPAGRTRTCEIGISTSDEGQKEYEKLVGPEQPRVVKIDHGKIKHVRSPSLFCHLNDPPSVNHAIAGEIESGVVFGGRRQTIPALKTSDGKHDHEARDPAFTSWAPSCSRSGFDQVPEELCPELSSR